MMLAAIFIASAGQPASAIGRNPVLAEWHRCIYSRVDFNLDQYQFRRTARMAEKEAKGVLKLCSQKFPTNINRMQRRILEHDAADHILNRIYSTSQFPMNRE